MRMLLEVLQQARLRLGFHTNIEISGPADSQANGRVEREIQTVRGVARTLVHGVKVHGVKEGCQMHIKPSSPVFLWAMRHAGWLLTHYRRQGGGPTAYKTRTGRKYCGKVAVSGERVLARVIKRANGSDKFEPGLWLGKTDRADFHMVATASGLKWTRTIPFDPEAVTYVKFWPGFGQIGAKASSLVGKFPTAPLPPALAPDDTLLQGLLDSLQEPTVESEVDKAPASPSSPKRSGGEGDVEDEMPKKMAKSAPKKMLKTRASSSEKDEPEPASASTIRMVVAGESGELLPDGDGSLEFPDQPPELTEAELAEVEDEATKEEIQLIGMTVLVPPGRGDDLEDIPLLITKLVMDGSGETTSGRGEQDWLRAILRGATQTGQMPLHQQEDTPS